MEKYNLETISAINDFIEDFIGVFPGLLSEEELRRRINANMTKNIEFGVDLGERISGQYKDSQVLVSKNADNVRKVLFHEFIHVITHCTFTETFKYHNFIEGLTTLAEEMYVKYKNIDMKDRKHVNGYIPTFVRELNFVKEGKFLETFLVNPSEIYKLFHPEVMKFDCPIGHEDKDYVTYFERMARKNESIVHMAKAGCTDDIINTNISDLESDILKQYHISVHIGEVKFSSRKFVELYNMQLQPNLGEYLEVLRLLRRENTISDEDVLGCGKLGLFYLVNEFQSFDFKHLEIEVDELSENELNWIASKIFGFYDIVYNHSDIIGDLGLLDGEEVDIDKIFEEQGAYEERLPIYRDLVKEVLRGNLNLDRVKDSKIKRTKYAKETSHTADYLLDKPKSAENKLLEMIFGGPANYKPTYTLESDNGVDLVYDTELFYYPIDIVTLEEIVRSSGISNMKQLLTIINGFSEQQILVCSEFKFDLEYFEDYPFKMYLFDGAILSRVGLESKGENVDINFKQVSFVEEGRSLFEKGEKDKFLVKSE